MPNRRWLAPSTSCPNEEAWFLASNHPSQPILQHLAGEVLFLWRMERHHPARVVDVPGALAAASRDGG